MIKFKNLFTFNTFIGVLEDTLSTSTEEIKETTQSKLHLSDTKVYTGSQTLSVLDSSTQKNKLHVYDVTDDDVSDNLESDKEIDETSTASSFSSMEDYNNILTSNNSSSSISSIVTDRNNSNMITDNIEEDSTARAQKKRFKERLNMFKSMT